MRTPAADRARSSSGPVPEPVRRRVVRQATTPGPTPAPPSGADRVGALQRSIGNAAVVRMIQRHEHDPDRGHPDSEPPGRRSLVHRVLRRPGVPLDTGVREEMEARFGGADFSGVRLHSGQLARGSAAEVGARAFTSGRHVVVGAGGNGRHTLAHELGHYLQQQQGPVGGAVDHRGLAVSHPTDRWEVAAERQARQVMSGPVPVLREPAPGTPAATRPRPVGEERGEDG
ncbi:eCIS core domain-containing protein [Embleya sp. MST-111070]|uniref:eCIS core domain-containing protein n=1 Tax=Embleya sp. MST-111070 TaxID=3398231 RepID=UPI003F737E33